MFEETLLIIKNDYLPKRKNLLIKLLGYGFQIQTNRRLLFTPELAAQFYGDNTDDENFMLQVILLSKGPSEAFILTMDNAVEQLKTSTICYFCNSVEAERHVHVSKTLQDACREIKFIFPNYICEPIPYFDNSTFCRNKQMNEMMGEIYDILKTEHEEPNIDWKLRLGNWLRTSNKNLPIVSNACVAKPHFGCEEKSAQTKAAYNKEQQRVLDVSSTSMKSLCSKSMNSSAFFTTSSCVSCRNFESSTKTVDVCKDLVAKKKAISEAEALRRQLEAQRKLAQEEQVSEEHICEDVEYIIVQEEQQERAGLDEVHTVEEHVAEEAEIKFGETSSNLTVQDMRSYIQNVAAEELLEEEQTTVVE